MKLYQKGYEIDSERDKKPMAYSGLQKMVTLTHNSVGPYMIVCLYGSLDVEFHEQSTSALSEGTQLRGIACS